MGLTDLKAREEALKIHKWEERKCEDTEDLKLRIQHDSHLDNGFLGPFLRVYS